MQAKQVFGVPLAASLIPAIDTQMEGRFCQHTKEEWKAETEGNKILTNLHSYIPIDWICVRTPNFRCHSQAITFKLKTSLSVAALSEILRQGSQVAVIPNESEVTKKLLNPIAASNSLKIYVGRIKKTTIGEDIYSLFNIGDQLLWGAAEPLRRGLRLIEKFCAYR